MHKITDSYGELDQKLMFNSLKLLAEVLHKKVEAAHKTLSMNGNIEEDSYALEIIKMNLS